MLHLIVWLMVITLLVYGSNCVLSVSVYSLDCLFVNILTLAVFNQLLVYIVE